MAAPARRGLGYRPHPRPSQPGDTIMIRLRHLAAASAVALWLTVAAPPLSAQSIVFDPNNYAQNVGSSLSAADFLRPGRVAQVGLDAGRPLLDSISGLMGYISFFENFIQIIVLLFAWVMVLSAFFILAIQLFVTLIEFKLTTLAGFVLIPFGLFGQTAFLAERVLGNVVSSGVKVLVLAAVVGIGSTLFAEFM